MRERTGCACIPLELSPEGEQGLLREKCGKNAEKLVIAAYLLWMTGSVLSVTTWKEYGGISVLSGLLRRTAHFLLLFEFLQRKAYTKKDAAGVFLLVFMGIVSGHSVYNSFVMPTLLFVFFSAQVRFRVILKITLLFHTIVMAVTVAASQAGIIEDVIWYEGERIRHSLGYTYCGYPAHFLLFMTLMWLCVRRKPRVTDSAVLLLANYLMYYFTDSRTDFYLGILAVAGAFLWTADYRSQKICALRGFLTRYGAAAAAAVSIAAQCFYNPGNSFLARLNLALNNRLQFGLDAIRKYGFSLFGKEIRWVGQGSLQADPTKIYNYVDCAFLKDGLSFGLLFLLLLLAGFYFTGKKLAQEGRHMEGWAMLVSLAYAVLNAHLCVLYFNVFILLLGENFSGQFPPSRSRRTVPQAAGMRHMLRCFLFLALILYMVRLQCLPAGYVVRTAEMHMWVVSGFLLLFSVLCREEEEGAALRLFPEGISAQNVRNSWFFLLLFLFLVLSGLSDLVLNKRFRNAPFFLLVFGGLFCRSWRGMKEPRMLLEEFCQACRAGFAAGLLYCIVARPARPGIRYSGFLPDPELFGALMIVCLAVFLSGMRKVSSARDAGNSGGSMRNASGIRGGKNNSSGSPFPRRIAGMAGLREIVNGIGAVTALYLIWLTQELSAAVSAAAVLTVYALFWLCAWFKEPGQKKLMRLLQVSVIAAAGLAAVLLLRFLLYRTAPALETQILYSTDKNSPIKVLLRERLSSAQEWRRYFATKWRICRAYLQEVGLTGHYYRAKYKGKAVWAANSLVMNLYRYGAAAGICFGFLLPAVLWKALKSTVRQKDFLPAGLAVSCFAVGMMMAVELPFANLNWLIFYFTLAWLLADEDKNEIFKYGN